MHVGSAAGASRDSSLLASSTSKALWLVLVCASLLMAFRWRAAEARASADAARHVASQRRVAELEAALDAARERPPTWHALDAVQRLLLANDGVCVEQLYKQRALPPTGCHAALAQQTVLLRGCIDSLHAAGGADADAEAALVERPPIDELVWRPRKGVDVQWETTKTDSRP